jgi:hypothetical protein
LAATVYSGSRYRSGTNFTHSFSFNTTSYIAQRANSSRDKSALLRRPAPATILKVTVPPNLNFDRRSGFGHAHLLFGYSDESSTVVPTVQTKNDITVR